MTMEVGSLFSGIGGIELGFEREGFKTKWFVENNDYCKKILAKNFPGVQIYENITTINWNEIPRVDILTGGFPCQDISNAGKRKGIVEGERSSLWKHFAEAIRILRPQYAVIENVSALTHRGLDVVLADLAKEGYDAEWFDIRASDVGAPHRRERIFIVAYPNSIRHIHGQLELDTAKPRQQTQLDVIKSSTEISNSESIGLQRIRTEGKQEPEVHGEERISDSNRSYGDIWKVEPGMGRVAHGIPAWMDRIRCLGNAVVPQVAQVIAQRVKMIHNLHNIGTDIYYT